MRNICLPLGQLKSASSNWTKRMSTSGSGDIRGAGGSFGKKEKAQEEQYFRQKEKEELEEFKKNMKEADSDKSKSKQSSDKKSPTTTTTIPKK